MALGWAIAARRPARTCSASQRPTKTSASAASTEVTVRRIVGSLGATNRRVRGCRRAPSEPTIRRTVTSVDAAEADVLVGRWLAEQVRAGRLAARQVPTFTALALDGKTLKGSWAVDRHGPR